MGQAIQFRGVHDVVMAYKMNGMAPWAIRCGKTIIHSYEEDDIEAGQQELQDFLVLLKKGGSEGKYELLVYRYTTGMDIDSKTVEKRGFGFSLWDLQGEGRFSDRAGFGDKALNDRMDRLEELILKGEEEEKEGVGGMIGAIMKMPGVSQALGMMAMGVVSKILPMNTQSAPAKVAGIQQQGEAKQSILSADQSQKAQAALNILCTLDPNLGDNLLKVAKVASDNWAMYEMFTTKML
jgi:hypothetical protein